MYAYLRLQVGPSRMSWICCIQHRHSAAVVLQESYQVLYDCTKAYFSHFVGLLVVRIKPHSLGDHAKSFSAVVGEVIHLDRHGVKELQITTQASRYVCLATS